MYILNANLIERPDDYAFFDPIRFKVIRLNGSAYRLINHFRTPISEVDFLTLGQRFGLNAEFLIEFIQRCISSQLLVYL